ncbi:MAG: hypothetical protein IIA45_02005 [Bacteroidetes bacterium]|nr:hypothetical protein [Bacteroidota bacterium]
MKNLIEISKILSNKRIGKIEVIDSSNNKFHNRKIDTLYQGIVKNKFTTEDEAAEAIYNTSGSHEKFRQLKSRLKQRIMNSLFFLDVNKPSYPNYIRAYYACNKEIALVNILISSDARNSAITLIKKVFKTAQKFKFTDILLSCARILSRHSSLTGAERDLIYYNNLTRKLHKILEAEMISDQYYQNLIVKYAKSASMKPELYAIAKDYTAKLKYLAGKYDSYLLTYNMFQVWSISYQIIGNYKSVLQVIKKTERFFKSNPNFSLNSRIAELALTKMVCYAYLKDFKSGKLYARECFNIFVEGSSNWFIFLEYYFILATHSGKYFEALQIYNKAVSQPRFKTYSATKLERWKIFESYLYFLYDDLEEDSEDNSPGIARFKLNKFLNEVLIASKDKQGYNAGILIIQIMILLKKGMLDQITDKVEALKTYNSRYLRMPENFRISTFIKMLLVMEREDFDHDRTKKIAEKFYKKLKPDNPKQTVLYSEIEIIPYERLWKMVLKELKKPSYQTQKLKKVHSQKPVLA